VRAWAVGEHLFVQADLEFEEPHAFVEARGVFPEMAFTDPPWNAGIAAMFRRKADDPRKVNLDVLLAGVALAHRGVAGDVWIEFAADPSPMIRAMRDDGWNAIVSFATTYERGEREESLTLFSQDMREPTASPDPPDSPYLPGWAISHSSARGEYVLDACTGYGLTTKAALKSGRRFVGFELTDSRLDRAITFAENHEKKGRVRVH